MHPPARGSGADVELSAPQGTQLPLAEDEGTFLLGTRTAGLSSHSPNPLASGALCTQQSLTCVSDCLLSSQGFCRVVFRVSTHSCTSQILRDTQFPPQKPFSVCTSHGLLQARRVQPYPCRAEHSVTFFDTSRHAGSTTALDSVFQGLITFSVKIFFLLSNLNLPWSR